MAKEEVIITRRTGWRDTNAANSMPCVIEVHSVQGNGRQYMRMKGTGELYGPFTNHTKAAEFIRDHGLNLFASVSIRTMYTADNAVETFNLTHKRQKVAGAFGKGAMSQPVVEKPPEYGPYTLRARAIVKGDK